MFHCFYCLCLFFLLFSILLLLFFSFFFALSIERTCPVLHFTTDYTLYVTNNKEPWPWTLLAHPSCSYYYLLSPCTRFFFLIDLILSYNLIVLHFLFHCTFYSYFSFFTIYMLLCCVTFIYLFYSFALSPERTWFHYISLLIIPCIIFYVTNKETLNLNNTIFQFLINYLKYLDHCILLKQVPLASSINRKKRNGYFMNSICVVKEMWLLNKSFINNNI